MGAFKTTKGTELPLMDLRGRDYLQVQWRIVWFREEKSDWGIETEVIKHDDKMATTKAKIIDPTGRVVSVAHKTEHFQHFNDYLEKSETGAIGRALANLGYGTQFCGDELDETAGKEGPRVVDSGIDKKGKQQAPTNPFVEQKKLDEAAAKDPGEFVVTFGAKYKGKKLKDIAANDLNSWVAYMRKGTLKGAALETVEYAEAYLATLPVQDEDDAEFNQAFPA